MTRAVVHAAIQGDRAAFVALVAEHRAMVCGLALAIVGDREASEDVAQDVFAATWIAMPTLRDPERFRAWLRQTTRNRAREHLRSTRRRHDVVAVDPTATDRAADPAPLPIDALSAAERDQALAAALAELAEEDREALILFYRDGGGVVAVARALDLSEVAARKRLSRARARLKADTEERLALLLAATGPRDRVPTMAPRTPTRPWSAIGLAVVAALLLALGGVDRDRWVGGVEPVGRSPLAAFAAAVDRVASAPPTGAPPTAFGASTGDTGDTGDQLPTLTWPDLDRYTQTVVGAMQTHAGAIVIEGCVQPWVQRTGERKTLIIPIELDQQGLRGYALTEEPVPDEVAACIREVLHALPWPPMQRVGVLRQSVAAAGVPSDEPFTAAQARQAIDDGLEAAQSTRDALVLHRAELERGVADQQTVTITVEGARSDVSYR